MKEACPRIRSLVIVPLLLIVTAAGGTLFAQKAPVRPERYVIAVSLKVVRRAVEERDPKLLGVAENLSWITAPKALLIGEAPDDLILVGEVQPGLSPLTLDDIVVAFRNMGSSMENLKTAPAVDISLLPGGKNQKVTFFGQSMENSRPGATLFYSDFLLKLLGFGYEPLGLNSTPNAWELWDYRAKMGAAYSPLVAGRPTRLFLSSHSRWTPKEGAVAIVGVSMNPGMEEEDEFSLELTDARIDASVVDRLRQAPVTIDWLRDVEDFSEVQARIDAVLGSEKQKTRDVVVGIARKLYEHSREKAGTPPRDQAAGFLRGGVSPEFAFRDILERNMDKMKQQYPMFQRLINVTALMGAVQATKAKEFGAPVPEETLLWWTKRCPLGTVETPKIIPVVYRGEPGVVGARLSGGVRSTSSTVPGVLEPPRPDLSMEMAIKGYAGSLRIITLNYRPSKESLSWVVPLDERFPAKPVKVSPELNAALLEEARRATVDWSSFVRGSFAAPFVDESGEWKGWEADHFPLKPHDVAGWNPPTKKRLMLEANGEVIVGTGQFTAVRIDQLSSDPPQEVFSLNYDVTLRAVFDDKVEAGMRLPFQNKLMSIPSSNRLPGLYDYKMVGGLANAVLYSRYPVMRGYGLKPSLSLILEAATPLYFTAYGGGDDATGQTVRRAGVEPMAWPVTRKGQVPFGLDGWSLYFGPGASIPLSSRFSADAQLLLNLANYTDKGLFVGDKEDNIKETTLVAVVVPTLSLNKRASANVGLRLGLVSKNTDSEIYGKASGTIKIVEAVYSVASRKHTIRVAAGLQVLPNDQVYYTYSVNFGLGLLSFETRKWF